MFLDQKPGTCDPTSCPPDEICKPLSNGKVLCERKREGKSYEEEPGKGTKKLLLQILEAIVKYCTPDLISYIA